ncbi:MAG: DUF459 domain-containing protein [Acidimicrobiia bacterium]|nr:DUF459 domain-containing protein [Acidimicrobiia bacterium]
MAVLVALGIGALLGSGALVGLAERQPLGTQRDVALGAAKVADRLAHGLSLNRPAERLAEALDGEEQVYDVEALIARARATAPAVTESPPPAAQAEDPQDEVPMPPVEDGGVAVEDEGAADAEPETGPPLDGLVTPIEGVDCVVTGSEPAPTTGDASEDPTEAEQPGGATPDRDGVDGAGEPDVGEPATHDPGSEEPDETDPAPKEPDTGDPATDDPASEEPDIDDPATDHPAGEEPGDDAGLPECPPGYVPASEDAEPPPDAAGSEEGEPGPEAGAFEPVIFEAPRMPDEERPLVMYVGGDSISRDLGEGLARVSPADVVRIDLDPRPATGLSRPDFFDWAQHLAGVLTESRPDVIVVLFGANDFQNVEHEGEILDRFGDEWLDLYRQRVDRIMTLVSQPDTQTIWVGQPPVRESRLAGGLERMNAVYAEVSARHPQITYIDTWALFSDGDGDYVDEIDGVRLRREDGVHLTVDGGNRLAEAVWGVIAPAWGLGDDPNPFGDPPEAVR